MYTYRRGNYAMRIIYWENEKWWLIYDIRRGKKQNHTHVVYSNENAARMIVIRADQRVIPEHYPDWMVDSINRLWFGKNYLSRTDLINKEELLRNGDPDVRIKRGRKIRGCKGYFNKPKHFRN